MLAWQAENKITYWDSTCIVGQYVAEIGSPFGPWSAEILQDGQHYLVAAARDGDLETHHLLIQVQHTETWLTLPLTWVHFFYFYFLFE